MKFSEQWLREWIDPPVDTRTLCEQLTTAGLEVDGVAPAGGDFKSVVVGRIAQAKPHPDAERLRVCLVDYGAETLAEVVCGAPNAQAGLVAPFAPVGARVSENRKIRASKIRGVKSHGMLCSPIELGLGDDADGLMELPGDLEPGADLTEALNLSDTLIEVDLTPNRGDCLGLIGIAREVGVMNGCDLRSTHIAPVPAVVDDIFAVALEAPEQCPKYVGRVIKRIDPEAQTPPWMVERLRRSGVRSISPCVDVTNYVMLELGQPLHAFDLEQLRGGVRVRLAEEGETLELLDGQQLTLTPDILVIADHERVLAMAGIMGGLDSSVTNTTTDIFLEGAFFEPRHVAGDARRFGLHTDASHRFERGVDPTQQSRAIEHATRLLLDIVGGEPGPVIETCTEEHMPKRPQVSLRRSRLLRVLGTEIDDERVCDIFKRLELGVSSTDDGFTVVAPGFRFDIQIEADLVEEVARIVGYDNIPAQRPMAALAIEPDDEAQVSVGKLRAVLVNRGYREAITYSFVDPEIQGLLYPETAISLANPISSDMRDMRLGLWSGLLQTAIHNLNRQQPAVRVFETGLAFQDHQGLTQSPRLAGLITGPVYPLQWAERRDAADFFDMKSDVEALLDAGDMLAQAGFVADGHPALHPGQSARVELAEKSIGWLGMLHPSIGQKLKVSTNIFLFELLLDPLCTGNLPEFKGLSKFPAVNRDLSLVLDEEVSSQKVRDLVGHCAGDVLKNLELFDVYHGEGIDPGKKSLSISLTFQASSHTLNDEEVESLVASVVDVLGTELGASLRG